ncbi:hypothetical protein M408DRAFT_326277, partial [Serendipita vermifera MAFF 305830]
MDQTTYTNRFSGPVYTGALQLDPYSRPPPSSPPNAAGFTPSSVLFPPQRSPKGPRPAPSSAHTHTFIEPAKVPLPADDVDASLHSTTTNTYYYGEIEEEFSNTAAEPQRNVPETLATSLFYGTSASPPPFARDTRTASISSTGSSHHHHRTHPSILNTFASAATNSAPDPWVEQASIAQPVPVIPDVIDLEANPISSSNTVQSTQALERSTVIGHSDSPTTAGKEAQVGSDQPIVEVRPDLPATDVGAGIPERVTFSSIFNHAVQKKSAVSSAGRKDDDVDPQVNVGVAGIKPGAEDVDVDDPIPSPNSPQDSTTSDQACAQSSLFESLVPPPFSTAATSGPVPIAATTTIITPTSAHLHATNNNRPSSSSANNSISKSSIIMGSHESSRMMNPLAESTTWEKVEGVNDEWQELSDPREDVLAMSESETDSELDDDEEDWEASRKVNTMADSAFLPSVERRRRLAAAEQLKKHNHDQEGVPLGSATPRGKRTPTTSFAHGKSSMRTAACAYEAYNPNGTPPTTTTARPSRSANVNAPPQSKLTPQQEQLVAELQRARTTRGVATPLVPPHQQMSRRAVQLSSD